MQGNVEESSGLTPAGAAARPQNKFPRYLRPIAISSDILQEILYRNSKNFVPRNNRLLRGGDRCLCHDRWYFKLPENRCLVKFSIKKKKKQ